MTKVRTFRWVCLFVIFLALITISETGATGNIYVFPGESIQAAVNEASSGDTIFVKPGEYNESIQVNQNNLTIVSESKSPDNTLISSGNSEIVLEITASNITISGLSITGSQCGIYLNGAQNCVINGNNISKNEIGICLYKSDNNTLSDNNVYSNIDCGIKSLTSTGNLICNNYFNNTNNARENKLNTWTCTTGNYWSDYTGTDKDEDGTGDTEYVINQQTNSVDYRPLMDFIPKSPVLPEAIFTSNVTVGYAPLTIEFTDFSENASSLSWSFGDLNTSNSSAPFHTFLNEGTYKVTLNVTNDNGSDSKYVNINVLKTQDSSVPVLPEAKFSANVTSGYVPLTVQFIDFSENAESLSWSLGDGQTSSCAAPRHTFCCPGNYTVYLEAKNNNGTSSTCTVITVLNPSFTMLPEAKFSASIMKGPSPLTVEFVDLSENATEWEWYFGDGNRSVKKSPSYTYTTPGNYTVSLKVGNEYGNDSKEAVNLIQVEDANITDKGIIVYSADLNAAANTVYTENSSSKDGEEGKGIAGILSKANLKSAGNFATLVADISSAAELKSSIEHEVLRDIGNVKAFTEGAVNKDGIRNLLWILLSLELLGIFVIISVLKRGKKR